MHIYAVEHWNCINDVVVWPSATLRGRTLDPAVCMFDCTAMRGEQTTRGWRKHTSHVPSSLPTGSGVAALYLWDNAPYTCQPTLGTRAYARVGTYRHNSAPTINHTSDILTDPLLSQCGQSTFSTSTNVPSWCSDGDCIRPTKNTYQITRLNFGINKSKLFKPMIRA